jgi:ubiquinone/menaquinone biosynthesis C-methylase UbiE
MNWYDKISKFYDFFTERIYHNQRIELLEKLELKKGDKVLLVACGTGISFKSILQRIGKEGMIVGIDNSEKMLEIAKNKINNNEWLNIKLINTNAENISNELIESKIGKKIEFDTIIGELAFSVIPNWKISIKKSIELLKQNGKIGILDGFRKENDLITKVLNFLPNSDINRNISEYLKELTENYWSKKLGKTGILFIGIGEKTTANTVYKK